VAEYVYGTGYHSGASAAKADGGGELDRGHRVPADIRACAPDAQGPPAEAGGPRWKTGQPSGLPWHRWLSHTGSPPLTSEPWQVVG
jgi:hypothetical protein